MIKYNTTWSEEDENAGYPSFVYGTLRHTHGNHRVISDIPTEDGRAAYSNVEVVKVPGITMSTEQGHIPFSFLDDKNPDAFVVTEKYTFRPEYVEQAMSRMDRLEGYQRGRDRNFYNRTLIEFTDDNGVEHKGWIYLVAGPQGERTRHDYTFDWYFGDDTTDAKFSQDELSRYLTFVREREEGLEMPFYM